MLSDKLSELKRLIPKGEWASTENTIITPNQDEIHCESNTLSSVEIKIILDFLTTLATSLSQLEKDYEWARQQVEIVNRDLKYFKGQARRWKRLGYDKALDELIDVIVNKTFASVKVRDEFQELLNLIEKKRKEDWRVGPEEKDYLKFEGNKQ